MYERIKIISYCKYIDRIIPDIQLFITKEYIDLYNIDQIFIPDNRTIEEIKVIVKIPYELGIVKQIPYTPEISKTNIIKRIKSRNDL